MQERRLNWRQSYSMNDGTVQNISSQFYPVTSAIALRDIGSSKQVTIMNDRSQAGSAEIEKGTIELIMHRRLLQDDVRGVEEPLNEEDANGLGIRVTARFYMHIFDRTKDKSR